MLEMLGILPENSMIVADAGRVYLWPDKARKNSRPPLVLRLITVHNGKHPIHLVTNVLSKKELSDRCWAKR